LSFKAAPWKALRIGPAATEVSGEGPRRGPITALTDILASAIALAGLQPVTGGRDRGVQRRGEAGQLLEVGQKRAPSQDIVDRVAVHSGRAGTF
jgi:hypothetical protein